ncbi:MAG: DUF1592 domain-containing protein, partial [Planctomycetia bacterium]|nr:DUF1592 domain-containing protein [Planctomycetia bacterium]
GPVIPAGSLLARWQSAERPDEKQKFAEEVQKLLVGGPPAAKEHPDAALYRQLASLGGPLFAGARTGAAQSTGKPGAGDAPAPWGIDPAQFGKHPEGSSVDSSSLCLRAPAVVTIKLPADLVAGCELVTAGVLHEATGREGSVQLLVGTSQPEILTALRSDAPVLTTEGSGARARITATFDEFRRWFPAALCYPRIVPVDEAVTLALFHREDEPLKRLMLDDEQSARIDRLWKDLKFVSHEPTELVDAYNQLMEYATQDGDPRLFEHLRKPLNDGAAGFRKFLVEVEPRQLSALVDFAAEAFRRPLASHETEELRGLYAGLRAQDLPHEEALRLTLARMLVSPAFLYRLEQAPSGESAGPVSSWELASRLSYFLWSSLPDRELRETANTGKLVEPDVLVAQARRMLGDAKTRRLAVEFGCQALHIYDFHLLDEKSERHFPSFSTLRGDMYEESIRFLTDLFQRDAPILELWDADHTFLNEALAKHYGVPGVTGAEWRRVDGVRQYGRGGVLGLATTLAKQSGASRTSPILRGNWVSEVLLGERLPRPPKEVPRLPEDETATAGLTVRQLVEKHSIDPRCSTCHARIDPFGFALEGYDAIGRRRDKDLADRPIETRARTQDGVEIDGLDGLRKYLLTARRSAVIRQFCRKLLGYSLGRGVQLSDGPLLDEMQRSLEQHEYRFFAAVEPILRSRQFREIRGRDSQFEDAN